jgi:hypothetical protein
VFGDEFLMIEWATIGPAPTGVKAA